MSDGTKKRILVVDDDLTSVKLLQLILEKEGHEVVVAGTGEEAYTKALAQPPALAIVDVVLPGMDGYALCRKLRQNPSTRALPIVMLTSCGDTADKLKGFEAGADDYLAKPFHPDELRYRVKSLLARAEPAAVSPAAAPPRGRVIAFFGVKGGVGKTTIAVNSAIALLRRTGKQVVLFDADFFFGDVGVHLNLPPTRSILDLVNVISELDHDLVNQVLIRHSSGLRVLLSPLRPEEAELVTAQHVKQLLDFLAASYDYVIVDCATSYDERALTILERADTILLIVTPEIGPLKNMSLFLDLAPKLGLAAENIHIVLNRENSNVGIDALEIERSARQQIAFRVVSGGRPVVQSVNRGVPLVLGQPNHPFALQITQIAERLDKKPGEK